MSRLSEADRNALTAIRDEEKGNRSQVEIAAINNALFVDPVGGIYNLIGKSVWMEGAAPAPQFDDSGRPKGFIYPTTAGELRGVDGAWLEMFVYNNPTKPALGGVLHVFNRENVRSLREAPAPESEIVTPGGARLLAMPPGRSRS